METWIAFGRGPLFRLSFVLMLLGLGRIFILAFAGGMKEPRDSLVEAGQFTRSVWKSAFEQVGIVGKLWSWRPFHSIIATCFHIGFIVVPLFLASHVVQWHKGVGFSWWELSQINADRLTLDVIVLAPVLTLIRLLSRKDHDSYSFKRAFVPLLLAVPFVTGYICVNGIISPTFYYTSMLIHVWVGNFIMLAIPFSTLAKCILDPMAKVCFVGGARFAFKIEPLIASFNERRP